MAIVITRWKCVQGAKYDGCGVLVERWQGVKRQKISLSSNERNGRGKGEITIIMVMMATIIYRIG